MTQEQVLDLFRKAGLRPDPQSGLGFTVPTK